MADPQGFLEGFKDRYGEGKEDYRLARYAYNADMRRDAEGARLWQTLATNPSLVLMKDLGRRALGREPDGYQRKREEMGMGLAKDTKTALGQVAGTVANDLTQDTSRGLWWLLNAPQAVGNVVNETSLNQVNPELFRHEVAKSAQGGAILANRYSNGEIYVSDEERLSPTYERNLAAKRQQHRDAVNAGLISETGQARKGVQQQYSKKDRGLVYTKRKFNPGDVAALGIPTGIAINAGIGLLNPLGGSGGYMAVLPGDEDPTKTANVIGEVAAKYILGRTGNLLPYEEFSKYRPDVDIGEYNRYKAFKYDKELDFNPTDGNVNLLPMGVLKATTEGIHGPEVQFLGRSLPVTTALVPYLGALAGGVAGVYQPTEKDEYGNRRAIKGRINERPIRRGLIGGMGGLAAGTAVGLIAEELRRRSSSNQVQAQGGNAEQYLQ